MRTSNNYSHWNILFKGPIPPINKYQIHIEQLCEKYKIGKEMWPIDDCTTQVKFDDGFLLDGLAYKHRAIKVPFTHNELTYIIALHEIGHVVTSSFLPDDSIEAAKKDEITAWKWAKVNANEWNRYYVKIADKALRSHQIKERQLFLRF